MKIVVDVDLVVVDTDLAWLKDLQKTYYDKFGTYKVFEWGEERSYDLHHYFPELSQEEAWAFWSKPDLYDNLVPKTGAYEALKAFHEQGDEIIFCSYCKKDHFGSKCDWLKKTFPFMDGFHATKEKHQITADIFIDDRNDMLNRRIEEDPNCIVIKFDTEYEQKEPLIRQVDLTTSSWEKIKPYSFPM
jgi:5'(3')-deoxyribonucleotidase